MTVNNNKYIKYGVLALALALPMLAIADRDVQCAKNVTTGTPCALPPPGGGKDYPQECVKTIGPESIECQTSKNDDHDESCNPNPHSIGLTWDVRDEYTCQNTGNKDNCCREKTNQPCIYEVYTATCTETTIEVQCSNSVKSIKVKRCNPGAPPTAKVYQYGATFTTGC